MKDCYYFIVEFVDEVDEDSNSIPTAIVSSSWVFEDDNQNGLMCWWPNFKSDEQRRKAVVQHKAIDIENCTPCKINLKYKTDVYQKAVLKLKQLELSSDVNTEDEKIDKRPIRGVKRYTEDFTSVINSDSSVSLSPPTPPKKRLKDPSCKGQQQARVLTVPLEPRQTLSTSCIDGGNYQEPVYIETCRPTTIETPVLIDATQDAICSLCPTIEGLCRRILEGIDKNGKKLDELTHFVNASIMAKNDVQSTTVSIEGLPLKTVEEMDNLESRLLDKKEYSNVLNTLKFVGGRDTFDTTRRIMSRVINNDLALIINWVGRNNKPAFKNYKNVLSVISDAVRINPLAARSSEQEIFSIIKMWLRGAVDRDGGRNKRKKSETN